MTNYKRTPKNYNGKKFPSKKMSDLLSGFLDGIKPEKTFEKEEVFNAWYAIIGPKFKEYTRCVSFKDGALVVLVKSQTLYSLLCTHEKPRLLNEMQRKFSKKMIRNIYFRIG